jgi:hypothetical protein
VPTDTAQPFDGLWNLRDLGGLPVSGGGKTRSGRLFRSGTLWFATMPDCNKIAGFRFDSCIDLRLPQEELHEDDWLCELLDLRYYHLPIEVPGDAKRVRLVHDAEPEHYLYLLQHNAARYIRALEIMSDDDNHPLLFHCAAGLDRTGVLAALVLACAAVEEEAIVADYAASAAGIGPIIDRYRGHKLYGEAARAADGYQLDAQVMRGFLDAIGGTTGLRDWAIHNGLKDTSLDSLRAALVAA